LPIRIFLKGIAAKPKKWSARFDVGQLEPSSLWPLETEENLLWRLGEHLGISSYEKSFSEGSFKRVPFLSLR
jgi:hypothetical protein